MAGLSEAEGGVVVAGIDHVAITVIDLEASCAFYHHLFGGKVVGEYILEDKVAVRQVALGGAMLSIHQQGNGISLVATHPTPGSADICLRLATSIDEAVALLSRKEVAIIEGPVRRLDARGRPAQSVYFKDPDGNLIELMS